MLEGTYSAALTVIDSDGASSTVAVQIEVAAPVAPTAIITATPNSGEAPLVVSFDAAGSSDSDGTIASYAWHFGDGETATGSTVSHTYTSEGNYTAQLTVTDDDGASSTTAVQIEVTALPVPTYTTDEPPITSFTVSPEMGEAPIVMTFDASGSADSDGSIVKYEWRFGDGSIGTGVIADHTYTSVGTYTARLTITDNDGNQDTASREVQVLSSSAAVINAPAASFNASPVSGNAPLVVEFDASDSSDSDGTIASYAWHFGDGETATGSTVSHTYTSEGNYTAKLTVTDDDGATDAMSYTIEVSSPSATPTCQTETTYLAADGLTVVLHSVIVVEKSGSYEYSIDYTLTNNSLDQAIDEGSFKMYYANEADGLHQYGFFGALFPGDTVHRTYTFEELKTNPFELLEYHHDNFFSQSPLQDSLRWPIPVPAVVEDPDFQLTVSATENEVDVLENWTYEIYEVLMWGELTLQATNISGQEFSDVLINAQAFDSNGVKVEDSSSWVGNVTAGMTFECDFLWFEAERIVRIDIYEIVTYEF